MAQHYLYAVDTDKWTSEMEALFDYVKIFAGKVYFITNEEQPYEKVDNPPEGINEWLTACDFNILVAEHKDEMEKAKAKLETDFKNELDKALAEIEETEVEDNGEEHNE